MAMTPTAERIRESAGRLFGDHGYSGVTIRQVADAAGVSPALVMKLFGNKAALYAACTPHVGEPTVADVPFDELGSYLVRRVAARLRTGESDPWERSVMLAWQAPDQAAEQVRFHEAFLRPLVACMPEGTDAQTRVTTVICQMVGLAVGLRTLALAGEAGPESVEPLLEHYTRLVQATLDGRVI